MTRWARWLFLVPSFLIKHPPVQVIRAGGLGVTAPGKYDPAAPLLGALAGPQPDSPDDPLRLVIRRAAQVLLGYTCICKSVFLLRTSYFKGAAA